jgi:ferritin-like metal-binding protein YciE
MTTPKENLVSWLSDAYAMEGQAVTLLETQIQRLESYPDARARLQTHLDATRRQQEEVERCLERLGSSPSTFKEMATKTMATMQGALHAMSGDEVLKHALGSYAFENFEAASYRSLAEAAQRAGEAEIASVCSRIQREEEEMASWIWEHLPQMTSQYLDRAVTGGAAKR